MGYLLTYSEWMKLVGKLRFIRLEIKTRTQLFFFFFYQKRKKMIEREWLSFCVWFIREIILREVNGMKGWYVDFNGEIVLRLYYNHNHEL